jgi:thiol-disulfide isomerase/thioredoxin
MPPEQLDMEGALPSFDGATGWLNSTPLSPAGLRGKVVVVQFWTYTCVNWRRSLPYVRAWADKYKDKGLVVVGVHTPEFAFERDVENVRWAARDMRIGYPIALDSDRAVWRTFRNEYWPALYIADAQGQVRHYWSGEGDYERSERMIQRLLGDAGATGVPAGLVSVEPRGAEVGADQDDLESPETYLRYERTKAFASSGGLVANARRTYAASNRLGLNQWALAGQWRVATHAAILDAANGRVAMHFHARDVNLVMGPALRGHPVRFRVLVDGQPPGAGHGTDVDEQGRAAAVEQRLYQLVRQQPPIGDRTVEIEFLDPGVEAYVFTFG